jgi:hypothetical protein
MLALVASAFTWGVTYATLRHRVSLALRIGRRAHQRLDELEDATGTRSALRDYPD